jgi:hypothetical protein
MKSFLDLFRVFACPVKPFFLFNRGHFVLSRLIFFGSGFFGVGMRIEFFRKDAMAQTKIDKPECLCGVAWGNPMSTITCTAR